VDIKDIIIKGSMIDKSDIGLENVENVDTTTTANITDSEDKRFVTDVNLSKLDSLNNLSGTNTGDVTVTDSAEIDFTLTEQDITANLKDGSINSNRLSEGVNDSLNLADSAIQTEEDPMFTASQASNITETDITNLGNLSGTNTGDQTSIVGISGTKTQYNTSVSDGAFVFEDDNTNTGWVEIASSTALDSATINIQHNRNTYIPNLMVRFLVSATGNDNDALDVTNNIANVYGASTGFRVAPVNINKVQIITNAGGIWTTEKVTNGYYKIIIKRV
jgi:hypothetical protein